MTQSPNPPFVDREVIQIKRNGLWLADGREVTHAPTRRLFARSLQKNDKAGEYLIRIGRESKTIEVEDTAFFISQIVGTPNCGFEVKLRDIEGTQLLVPFTLEYRPGRLTCEVLTPLGHRDRARFLSAPYFDLLQNLQEDERCYYLVIQSQRVELAPVSTAR